MPDITLCQNNNCEHKDKCYRYRAKPNELWQSYSMFNPETDKCFLDYRAIARKE